MDQFLKDLTVLHRFLDCLPNPNLQAFGFLIQYNGILENTCRPSLLVTSCDIGFDYSKNSK